MQFCASLGKFFKFSKDMMKLSITFAQSFQSCFFLFDSNFPISWKQWGKKIFFENKQNWWWSKWKLFLKSIILKRKIFSGRLNWNLMQIFRNDQFFVCLKNMLGWSVCKTCISVERVNSNPILKRFFFIVHNRTKFSCESKKRWISVLVKS